MRSEQLIDTPTAVRILGQGYFNLVRRGADGSLVLSADRWRVKYLNPSELLFEAQADAAPDLSVPLADVDQMSWDRLPKQQTRSQVRVLFRNGDLWSFSGIVQEDAVPSAPPAEGPAG